MQKRLELLEKGGSSAGPGPSPPPVITEAQTPVVVRIRKEDLPDVLVTERDGNAYPCLRKKLTEPITKEDVELNEKNRNRANEIKSTSSTEGLPMDRRFLSYKQLKDLLIEALGDHESFDLVGYSLPVSEDFFGKYSDVYESYRMYNPAFYGIVEGETKVLK